MGTGIYEGLKVFENEGKDIHKMMEAGMKGLSRTENSKRGKLLGYLQGLDLQDKPLYSELEARFHHFVTPYKFVLENNLADDIDEMKTKLEMDPSLKIVLLDARQPNPDWKDLSSPISHCPLVRLFLKGEYPTLADLGIAKPLPTPSSSVAEKENTKGTAAKLVPLSTKPAITIEEQPTNSITKEDATTAAKAESSTKLKKPHQKDKKKASKQERFS